MPETVPDTGPIYLDYQASTPVDPRVLSEMLPWFTENFANPSSGGHAAGMAAAEAVERARAAVAALIGAEAREIVFTSGATESNNLAIKGAARYAAARDGRRHVVSLATEHKCVLESCARLAEEGFEVEVLPVRTDGLIDLDRLAAALRDDTALVSVMAVNNETGTIQPLADIGALTRARGILLHSDAAQATGRIRLDMGALDVDLLSISGHKIYGPKGVGALYVRRRPRARLVPLLDGGGQERTLRSGTVPVPLVVGLGAACGILAEERESEQARLAGLAQRLFDGLAAAIPGLALNGAAAARIGDSLNIRLPETDARAVMAACPGVAMAMGAACTSEAVTPSYVLTALGLSDDEAAASLRLAPGRPTTEAEIDLAASRIAAAWTEVRRRAA